MISSPIFSARSRASVLTRTASVDLLPASRSCLPCTLSQPVVADEGDVVEIDLRLDLRRQHRILGDAAQDGRAQQADEERAGDRRSDRGGEIVAWCRAASRRRPRAPWARR